MVWYKQQFSNEHRPNEHARRQEDPWCNVGESVRLWRKWPVGKVVERRKNVIRVIEQTHMTRYKSLGCCPLQFLNTPGASWLVIQQLYYQQTANGSFHGSNWLGTPEKNLSPKIIPTASLIRQTNYILSYIHKTLDHHHDCRFRLWSSRPGTSLEEP